MAEMVDIHALAGAYALDAVDDIERAAFDRHLRDCSTCALEVAELRETTTWLAYPTIEAPPPRLREAVLTAAARTPQERARPSGSSSSTATPNRWRRWAAATVAASVLGLGVAGGTWAVSEQRLQAERATSAKIDAVLGAADAQILRKDMGGGQVSLIVSPSRDAGVAVLTGLDSPGTNKIYQLWMIGGPRGTEPVGMLPVGKGDGRQYIDGLRGATTFGVSREKEGGADQPTPNQIVDTIQGVRAR